MKRRKSAADARKRNGSPQQDGPLCQTCELDEFPPVDRDDLDFGAFVQVGRRSIAYTPSKEMCMRFTLNGKESDIPSAFAEDRLLWLLRDHFYLNGPKYGCGV